jgi:hypothetical protein
MMTFVIFNFGCASDESERYLHDLKSENITVVDNAIYFLAKEKDTRAVPMLRELINSERPKPFRLSAIQALGQIGEDSSVDTLIDVLNENENEIKLAAVEAIGKIKNPQAIKTLINLLENQDLRLTVIWALGNIGDYSAVPVMTELLDDEDKFVRYNAAQALKKIGGAK